MQAIDHIIYSRWVLAGESDFTVLENHAVAIQDGKIQAILPEKDMDKAYTAPTTSRLSEHLLIPGLINTHTHIAMNYFRGLADDLQLMDWLNNHIWPAESKWVTHAFVRDASLFAMAEMIRCGTTCFNDMYFFPQATAEAAEQVGMRAHLGMTVIEFPTNWAKTTDEYFAKGLEFCEQYQHHPRIRPVLAPHAPYTVSDASFQRVQAIADEYDLKINLHLHETEGEVTRALADSGKRPIQRLHDLGLMSPRLIAIHMAALNEADIDIVAKTKPAVVHCPESNMKLACGISPVTQLAQAGIKVALGTDSASSNNDLDMISEMRTASLLAKLSTGNPEALPVAEILGMATRNGAAALGIADETGSLVTGKAADITAIRLDDVETLPIYHPLSQLVYASNRQQVTDVWVGGKQLLKNRVLTTLDEAALKAKAREWQAKIKG